jgi:hypothetical protein
MRVTVIELVARNVEGSRRIGQIALQIVTESPAILARHGSPQTAVCTNTRAGALLPRWSG